MAMTTTMMMKKRNKRKPSSKSWESVLTTLIQKWVRLSGHSSFKSRLVLSTLLKQLWCLVKMVLVKLLWLRCWLVSCLQTKELINFLNSTSRTSLKLLHLSSKAMWSCCSIRSLKLPGSNLYSKLRLSFLLTSNHSSTKKCKTYLVVNFSVSLSYSH